MDDWKSKQKSEHAFRERQNRERAEEKEKDRELSRAKSAQQFELVEMRAELAQKREKEKAESEALLELVRHRLEPEQLNRLYEDFVRRKQVDLQAHEQELQAQTDAQVRVIENEGDDTRRTIMTNLKARLIEMLLEHRLRSKDREQEHSLAKDMATHQAGLGAGSNEMFTPEELDLIDSIINGSVDRN